MKAFAKTAWHRKRITRITAPALVEIIEPRVLMAVDLVVTNMTDVHVGGELSLREALEMATQTGGDDYIIEVPAGMIELTQGVLVLDNNGHELTIEHTGPGAAVVNGAGQSTVMKILAGTTAFVNGIVITGGQANQGFNSLSGGGLQNAGTLTLNQSIVTGNNAGFAGGGIANTGGVLTLNNSTVAGNDAQGFGGGGIANNNGTVTIKSSTFASNSTPANGGALFSLSGTYDIVNSTFSGNSAATAGGIFNSGGTITVTDSTVAGSVGGGLENSGTFTLNGVIVDGTVGVASAPPGVGVPSSTADLNGTYVGTHNLIADASGTGLTNPVSGLAMLAPLGDFGGFTQTMPPLPGSPAIAAGGTFSEAAGLDQRGVARNPSTPTIGAFESYGFDVTITSTAPAAFTAGQSVSFDITTEGFPTPTISVAGTLPAGLTLIDNADGTATVSGVANVAGDYALTFTATNNAGEDAVQPITLTINAAAASQLVFNASPPSTSAAGQSFGTVTVDIADVFGNVVTTSTAAVTLSANATLAGTSTVAAVNGTATFTDLSIYQAGSYTLTASAADLASPPTSAITITPAAAHHLTVLAQPTTATIAGQSIGSVSFEVQDEFGNRVTSDVADVTVSIAGATLSGTTVVAAQNGVVVFDDLSIPTGGTYTLTAARAGLVSATTSAVTITPVTPANVVIAGAKSSPVVINTATAFPTSSTPSKRLTVRIESDSSGDTVLTRSIRVKNGSATITHSTIRTAGVYNRIVTDAEGHTTTDQFAVVASAPAKLAFASAPTVANGTTAASVQVVDRYGNVTTDADGAAVTLHLRGPAIYLATFNLSGTTTATVIDGVATFSDVQIARPGLTRLLATADGLRTGRSDFFENV